MQIRSQVTQTVRRLWVRLPAILAAIVVLGLFVRLTIRDRWPLIALFFYMTPLLLLAVSPHHARSSGSGGASDDLRRSQWSSR